ncbi:hypothetical protein BH09ACT1_BH09ACT1_12050 [soil metagenome]
MTNWGIRRIALALLALYIAAGAAVLLWPTRVDAPFDAQLAVTLATLHSHGVPAFVNYAFVESSANVVMFFPLGVLLTLMWSSRLAWIAPAAGFLASAGAELAQLWLLPNRVASVEDVYANTAGAVIGTLVVLGFRAASRNRRRTRPIAVLHSLDVQRAAA